MHKSKAIAADVLIDKIMANTLSTHLRDYRKENFELYIPFGIRAQVEENLDREEHTIEFHRLLKEGIQQRLIVNSRHKYTLEHDFKTLYRNLSGFSEKLTEPERHLIALSLQLGIEIDTNDDRIVRIINEIKTTPHLQKYVMRLMSRGTGELL